MNNTEEERVKELLRGIQLEQYYRQIYGKLHVTRLSHFDHVAETDLDDLGMAKPEQRRLLEALKKAKKKSLFSSFRRKKSKKTEQQSDSVDRTSCYGPAGDSLTCLISEQSVTLFEMLGNGAFGYVRKGTWVKDSNKKVDVAVKCLKSWSDKAFQQMQMDFIKEANAMSLLDHPHIIRLHGIVLSVPMMLVTELAPLGCLLMRLRDEPHSFTISCLSDFVVQIAAGMAYLESHRFVHRDLAARNLLLESYEKVKIGDFGMMHVLTGDEDHYTMHPSGKIPFAWCPQEVLKFRKFSHASDVWAFGITVVELFSYGMEPWPGLNGAEILEKVDRPLCERPKKPDHCPTEIFNILLSQCWVDEPHQRARFSTLKKMVEEVHPVNVSAIFPYESKCQQNLSFHEGDIVTLLEASVDVSWWKGQNMRTRKVGLFPSELVDSGLKRAVSPVKNKGSPKARSPSKKHSSRNNCDCGIVHLYETPVVFLSDPSVTGSSRSSSRSSRSVESNFTSSIECDSGYSSSVDTRRFRLSNGGDNSPEQRKANLTASYENTNVRNSSSGKQNLEETYELMSPISGPTSSPIPIPKQGSGESHHTRNHCSPDTPQLGEAKCPLDFSSLSEDQPSVNQNESPPPLPPRKSTSLPVSPVTHASLGESTRLTRTPSPSGSKISPLESGVGEAFVKEMLTFLEKVSVDARSAGPGEQQDEEDIYEDLSGSCVSAETSPDIGNVKNSLSKSQRGKQRGHFYENHSISGGNENTSKENENGFSPEKGSDRQDVDQGCDRVRCNSAQLYSNHQLRDVRCNTWPTKQGDAESSSATANQYENHELQCADVAPPCSKNQYDNCRLGNESLNKTESGEPALPPCSKYQYDNCKLRNESLDSLSTSRQAQVCERRMSESLKPSYENVELRVEKSSELYEDMSIGAATKPEERSSLSGATTAQQSAIVTQSCYENFTPKGLQNDNAERSGNCEVLYENCEIQDPKKESSVEGSGSVAIPGVRSEHFKRPEVMSYSLPSDCSCINVVSGEDAGTLSMIVETRVSPPLRRTNSADAIRRRPLSDDDAVRSSSLSFNGVHFAETDSLIDPVPPPRWKRIARMSRTQSLAVCSQQRWSVNMTPELASVLSKRFNITEGVSPIETSTDNSPPLSHTPPRVLPPVESSTGASLLNHAPSPHTLESAKPVLPPRTIDSQPLPQTGTTPANRSRQTYENVEVSSITSVKSRQPEDDSICPPALPPKEALGPDRGTCNNQRHSRSRAAQYENVNSKFGSFVSSVEQADDTPPPLPRKLSRTKSPPVVP